MVRIVSRNSRARAPTTAHVTIELPEECTRRSPRPALGGPPTAKPRRTAPLLDDVHKHLPSSVAKAQDALKRDLSKLRAGRATPALLEGIRVDYYGTATPLAQMAHVNVPEPRLITIKPWDKTQIKAVEKALRESDLGLNPQGRRRHRARLCSPAHGRASARVREGREKVWRGVQGVHPQSSARRARHVERHRERRGGERR